MTLVRTVTVAGLATILSLGLGACSGTASSKETAQSTVDAVAVTGTASEIAFAQSMIPHHQQAIEMADMALSPQAGASPEVRDLAVAIESAQGPEIEQMTTWLQVWGAPTAMPGADDDMAGMDHSGHDMGGITMSGMVSNEDMAKLRAANGAEFDAMWLEMMIAHHEGAITMAEQVRAESSNVEVTTLADAVISGQTAEITTMQQLLTQ